jgi:hypothetical protein
MSDLVVAFSAGAAGLGHIPVLKVPADPIKDDVKRKITEAFGV